jgi:hypothetical protein
MGRTFARYYGESAVFHSRKHSILRAASVQGLRLPTIATVPRNCRLRVRTRRAIQPTIRPILARSQVKCLGRGVDADRGTAEGVSTGSAALAPVMASTALAACRSPLAVHLTLRRFSLGPAQNPTDHLWGNVGLRLETLLDSCQCSNLSSRTAMLTTQLHTTDPSSSPHQQVNSAPRSKDKCEHKAILVAGSGNRASSRCPVLPRAKAPPMTKRNRSGHRYAMPDDVDCRRCRFGCERPQAVVAMVQFRVPPGSVSKILRRKRRRPTRSQWVITPQSASCDSRLRAGRVAKLVSLESPLC